MLQVALTIAGGWAAGRLFGLAGAEALYLGAILVASSSMVILKSLLDRGEIASSHGRLLLSMSIVQDLVEGLMLCALRGAAGEVYNLASGVETTIRELADTINAITGNPTPVELKPARDWDRSGRRFGATEKSKRTIGFQAKVKLRAGLEQTIAWTRANEATIRRCMAQHDQHMRQLAKAG